MAIASGFSSPALVTLAGMLESRSEVESAHLPHVGLSSAPF